MKKSQLFAPDPRYAPRFSVILVCLLCAGTLHAQSPTPAATPTAEDAFQSEDFFEFLDIEIVNIDVYVTDKDGKPVEGLTKDDFVVLRNGTAMEATNFYAVADGSPVAPPVTESAEGASADEDPAFRRMTSKIPEDQQLWMIVFIDNYNIDPIERNRILPAVRQFLGRTLSRDDQAMIVTFDRGLDIRQPFTDQKDLLIDRLFEIEDDSGLAVIRRRDRYDALRRIEETKRPDTSLLMARTYAEEVMDNAERTTQALERLVETLGGLPGRKALLHVSSGVPMLAGEELFQVVGVKWNLPEAYAEIGRHDVTRGWERVNRRANAHRVVFYTMDAGGLRGLEFTAAEYSGFLNPKIRSTLDSVVTENLQASLRLMAIETGGRAILNRNEMLPALLEVAQDFRSYYSLGIPSSGADSGRYHQIEVKLRKPQKGLKIRHRSGYQSKNLDTRMREDLRSTLLYGRANNPFKVSVRWGKPEPEGRGTYVVPMQLQIPLEQLVLLPMGEKHELRLELYIGAADEEGSLSEVDKVPLGLRLAPEHVEAARKESFLHTHRLKLKRGPKKVAVTVLDGFGRQHSTVTSFLNVGADP